jgi:methylmalonyl-CoA/ethylmalonyl-CoA epimerase
MAPVPENRAMVSAIGQIALTVTNLPRALQFYRDTLGLKFLFEASNMAFFDCGGVRLMLTKSEQPESTYSSIVYYRTDDIQKASEQLRSRDVLFESPARMIAKMPDHELWMAFFRDTE